MLQLVTCRNVIHVREIRIGFSDCGLAAPPTLAPLPRGLTVQPKADPHRRRPPGLAGLRGGGGRI